MSKTLVGIVTFGNLEFTKLTVKSIRETSKSALDFFIVVGKPGDVDTVAWLTTTETDIKYKIHDKNMGFPYSLNDIYDYAWVHNNYDYLIISGNDVVAYPNCVDSLIYVADNYDYECISALQFDVKDLVSNFPDTRELFSTDNYIFTKFDETPWNNFTDHSHPVDIADMQLYDIQNMCLYKKSLFDKIGYTDVNFYPAYFVDNDYARRIVKSGLRCCTLRSARFFHFWSRTIHQEKGGSTNSHFKNNEKFYKQKWGGPFAQETIEAPVKIDERFLEEQIIDRWR